MAMIVTNFVKNKPNPEKALCKHHFRIGRPHQRESDLVKTFFDLI